MSLPPVLSDKKALITMTWDTLWLFLTMFIVYYHSGFTGMKDGYTVAVVLMLGVWLVFLVIRYLPVHEMCIRDRFIGILVSLKTFYIVKLIEYTYKTYNIYEFMGKLTLF